MPQVVYKNQGTDIITIVNQKKPSSDISISQNIIGKNDLINHLCQLNHKAQLRKYARYKKDDQDTLNNLLIIIKDSANNSDLSIPASRALTILSELNYDFSDLQLQNVQVNGAEITEGIFKNTNFCKSNFSGVKLNLKSLSQAIIDFDVISSIEEGKKKLGGHKSMIRSLKFSFDGRLLLSTSDDNTIRV